MKTQTLSALFALAASLQQVSAGWSDSPAFRCPQNSCDKCTSQQSSGFDWSDLAVGDFSFYGGFAFEGFSCSNSFAKRDQLTGRHFQNKCITGHASSEPDKCPKASCSDVSSFSIDTVEISVEFDIELEFQYGMDDGSTCKQRCSCSSEGTSVKNTQCGGARNVTVVLPTPPKNSPTCGVGIHSIGFNCPSSCTTTTQATSTPLSYTTPPVIYTTTPLVISSSSIPTLSIPTNIPVTSTTPYSTTSSSTVVNIPYLSSLSLSSAGSSTVSTSSSLVSGVAPSYTHGWNSTSSSAASPVTTSAPAESFTTIIVDTTVTTCPVTNVYTTGGTTSTEITQIVSTITSTRTSTVCTKCEASATSITEASAAQSSVSCPSVLPSCLNTWMSITTSCSSINDYSCFCPNSNFTTLVFACLSAHGASDSEVSAAQVYFQGICAEYVPQNPAIITAASTLTATATLAGPVTTINVYTTIVVPCTQSNGPASTTTTISSAITVPQVVLTTVTGTSVGLYPGTPAPVTTTAATAAIATTMATLTPTYAMANGTGITTASPSKFTGGASRSGMAFSVIGAALAFSFFAI